MARTELLAAGFADCPDWLDLLNGKRPPTPDLREPGEFAHGWQYFAASRLETTFREGAVLPAFGRPLAAHLRSQAGRCSGCHLTVLPVNKEFTWSPAKLRVLLLRRLRLPLHAGAARCRCGRLLDALGDHCAACSTSGVLKLRAKPVEKAWARVCREAGARVQENVFLRELNLASLDTYDDRRLEVLATGLPLHHGAQLAVDTTLVAPLTRKGEARPRAWHEDGAALVDARHRKETRYPELLNSRRCLLVVTGHETGGRWSEEAYDFVLQLAAAKAREAPFVLRGSALFVWLRRWTALVSMAAQNAFASTLLYGHADAAHLDGNVPELSAALGADRLAEGPGWSRMPA